MPRPRLKDALVRAVILAALSVGLVLAFWFHGEFYQMGLLGLVLVGGAAVFAVLILLGLAVSPRPLGRRREMGSLEFENGEAASIVSGSQTAVLLPLEDGRTCRAGSVYAARHLADGNRFARLHIKDARRVLLQDVCEADANDAGFEGLAHLMGEWKIQGRDAGPDAVALLVRFAALEGKA